MADADKDTKYDSLLEAEEILVVHLINKYKFKTIQQDEKIEIWGYQEGIYVQYGASLIHSPSHTGTSYPSHCRMDILTSNH